MIHQGVEPTVTLNDRPKRDTIIQRDDVISLKIDINLLSVDEFITKYCFDTVEKQQLRAKYKE